MKKTHHLALLASGLLLAGAQLALGQAGLVNGNFENQLNGWTYSGVTAKSPAIESNYSACFDRNASLSQTFSVIPGASYSFVYTYAPGNNTNRYHIGFKIVANGTVLNTPAMEYSISYPPSSITGRYQVYSSFVVPSGLTNVTLVMTNESAFSGTKPLLDDIQVTLQSAVTILSYPQDQTVNVGESASFSVEAIGTPVLNYQWYFENDPIAGATSSSLSLANCQQTNAGNYHVEVSDPYGSSWTSAKLFIAGPFTNGGFENGLVGWIQSGGVWLESPAIEGDYCAGFGLAEELAQAFWVTPGETYMLKFDTAQCGYMPNSSMLFSVKAGETELDLTGYASDIQGPEGFKYHAQCFYQFTVPAGASNVTVMFKDNTPDTSPSSGYPVVDNVSIHSVVLNSQPASEYAVAIGESVSMSVSASGTAPLSYQWKRNGAPISGATGSSLNLSNLQQVDSGTYTVVVSNSADAVETAPSVLRVAGAFANGDFENGLAAWEFTSGVSLFTEPPLEGNASVGFGLLEDQMSQSFAVTPGATYTLQYDFAEYGEASGSQVYAGVRAGFNYLDLPSTSTPIEGPDGYSEHVRVTAQFTVPQDVTAVTLTFWNSSWPAAGSLPVVDSVSVQ